MLLTPPVEPPQDGKSPSRFLLEDKDFSGIEISAEIDFTAKKLVPVPAAALLQTLIAPVTAYGNVVTASRGETVAGEVLGSGNASIGSQTFKLKKSPLTYQPAPTGVASTLTVYVNGLQWTEVPSFFGTTSAAEVYIVRQNDDGDSFVTFGDGARGSRLPSGNNNVVAYYRYGAGKASPPSGSIHQMAKPIKGITGVRNPVAAAGGDDAEGPEGLRTYAPRSALLLGRAISIADMEAATAEVGGVRAVRVEWRWNPLRQRPVVQVWYVGSANLVKDVRQKLRALSDSVAPIDVEHATPVPGSLSLSIQIDSRRIEGDVLIEIRKTLMNGETGLLAPERIGIGLALFRSRIFEIVLGVPGAVAVTGLLWNGRIFNSYGIQPGSGKYFDLEAGALILNGKADDRE
jgi:predicted phage baseplate assembly protein